MDLSIVIVNWNACDLLRRCLVSLRESRGSLQVQVIVVDNNSRDDSRAMVTRDFPEVQLVASERNLGFGRGSNLGLQQATAPLVLFLNPDTEAKPGALERMVAFLGSNPGVGALGCKIRDVGGGLKPLGVQWFPSPLTELFKFLALSRNTHRRWGRLIPYHDPEVSGPVRKLFGACLLVRREVLDRVGAFDERFFMYCEDVDLCRRILEAGWTLYYLSDAEILHWGGASSSKASSSFAVLMGCESFHKLMHKYYGRLGAMLYRIVALVGAQARMLMLMGLWLGSYVLVRLDRVQLKQSIAKYAVIMQWAAKNRRPTVEP